MGIRPEKIAREIQRLVSQIFQNDLKDPRINSVTITKVEVTADLKLAKIYYTVLGGRKEKENVEKGIRSAMTYIRRRIADNIRMKFIPKLEIKPDMGLDYSAKIERIIEQIHSEENYNEENR